MGSIITPVLYVEWGILCDKMGFKGFSLG